ncbi:MAG: hypothetical protein JXR97_01265 [Planctomycetes bacterium]|nr:hypothetical protein [Planctomycetota bacterium]
MKESTQGFLMGLSAALAGIMLYICCTYGGALFMGADDSSRDVSDRSVAEAAPDSGAEMVVVSGK